MKQAVWQKLYAEVLQAQARWYVAVLVKHQLCVYMAGAGLP